MARKKAKLTGNNDLSVNPFALDAVSVEQLRRKLAKQANQRLVRLERRKASTGEALSEFSQAQYAYEQIRQIRSKADVKGRGSKGRFREQALPLGESQARMELYVLQSFLSDERSKAGKAARYVSKTEKTFLERGISAASFKSFYNFLNSATFGALKGEGLSSDDVVELYSKAHEEGKSFAWINNAITEYLAQQEESAGEVSIKGLEETLGVKLLEGGDDGDGNDQS